jgi:hypothetical protein
MLFRNSFMALSIIELFRVKGPVDYPNRLYASASPGGAGGLSAGDSDRQPKGSAAIVCLLLLVCLLPRLWVACQQETICPDAVQYLDIAEALRQGNYAEGFEYLNLNIYPAILLVLLQTGSHWVAACETWSLVMAALAVLPLFGLMRRLFDVRAAVLACLLYALHPRLIVYSPLILRDPTFWFLFLLSLYLQWRAATEMKWWLFLAAGGALFLTIHTRTEGWLLLIPLVLWTMLRLWFVSTNRRRLLAGTAAVIAMIPLSTVTINLTLLRDQPQWHMASTRNFQYAWNWLRGADRPPPDPEKMAAVRPNTPPVKASAVVLPKEKIFQRVVVRFTKTFTYVYGLVILAGLWSLRRNLLRGDTLPFFFISTVMFTGIWIRYNVLPIDERYFFPILMASLPGLSLGMLQIAYWIAILGERIPRMIGGKAYSQPAVARPVVLLGMLAVLVIACAIDGVHAANNMFIAWREQADLGKWILQQHGPRQTIAGNNDEMRLVAYYGEADLVPLWDKKLPQVASSEPDKLAGIVVFWEDYRVRGSRAYKALRNGEDRPMYQDIPTDSLPPSCRDLVVLERAEAEQQIGAAAAAPRR